MGGGGVQNTTLMLSGLTGLLLQKIVALPLLPATGIPILDPYPHLNPIFILFEGYTSPKVQCRTNVSCKPSFWYPCLGASVPLSVLKAH
jgi:hypothetical protein